MKYQVIRDQYGFQGRYWTKGEIVDLDPKVKVPSAFMPLAEAAKVKEPDPGSAIADKASSGTSKPGDVIKADPKTVANTPVK